MHYKIKQKTLYLTAWVYHDMLNATNYKQDVCDAGANLKIYCTFASFQPIKRYDG